MNLLKNFKLNENETVISTSHEPATIKKRGGFVLTNQRIIYVENKPFYKKSTHSFDLENLDSIETSIKKEPALLALGGVFLFLSAIFSLTDVGTDSPFLLVIFIICLIASIITYLAYSQKILKLSSGRSDINLNVEKLSEEKLQRFLVEINKAKRERIEKIRSSTHEPIINQKSINHRDKLLKLKDLFDQGLITEEEYRSKKQEILSKF